MSQRCRVVDRWSWVRLLRDHGPRSKDWRLAMHTLFTFMDTDSGTYTGVTTWAAAACMGINTLQKQKTLAIATGWLVAEQRRNTKGWKTPLLRCTAPYEVTLGEKDEVLADALLKRVSEIEISVYEDPDESVSFLRSDTANKTAAVSTLSDTANTVAVSVQGDIASDRNTGFASTGDTAPISPDTPDIAISDEHKNGSMLYPKTPEIPFAISLEAENPACYIFAISEKSRNPLAALGTQKEVLEVVRDREVVREKLLRTEGPVSENRTGVSTVPAPSKRTIPDTNNPSPAIRAIRDRNAKATGRRSTDDDQQLRKPQ